jgi:hypothetical protein
MTSNIPLPTAAQAFQYVERFGTKGGRSYARKLAGLSVKTTAQKALVAALWQEINRRSK